MPHLIHVLAKEAPTAEEYVPTPQFTQSPCAVAPVVVRYLPAPHSMHTASPVTILYFPSAHAAHDTPLSPVYPMLHRHLVESVEPLVD
jgi:hypothetical protein